MLMLSRSWITAGFTVVADELFVAVDVVVVLPVTLSGSPPIVPTYIRQIKARRR